MSREAHDANPQRRASHVELEVAYASVGASASADLMRFPPAESTPYEFEVQLGSGAERFLIASNALMTWGAQRGSGIGVSEIEYGDGGKYRGVVFDESGTPVPASDIEQQFGPNGEPYIVKGTTVTLQWPDGRSPRRVRVVYTIDEARRLGYAWGNTDRDGVYGEEVFTVEHRDDDTVWALVRGFLWPPEGGLLSIRGKSRIKQATKDSHAQILALVTGVLIADA